MDTVRIMSLLHISCFITLGLIVGAFSQNDLTVQPGPVKVKLGSDASLWCKFKYDPDKVVPVNWQAPPEFKTRTGECTSYMPKKYKIDCSTESNPFKFYNLTILKLTWADNGVYRCLYTRHKALVDLQVLVPVTGVTLTHVSNSTAEPLFLSKGTDAVLTCQSSCASPAPKITWSENDQPFKGTASANHTECTGALKGQKRTTSVITVKGQYTDKDSKNSKITCTAKNVDDEDGVSRSIAINYDDAATGQNIQAGPLQQAEIIGVAAGAGVGLLLILLGVACFLKTRRSRSRSEEEDEMNKKPPPPTHV